jgi:hypothetical protein
MEAMERVFYCTEDEEVFEYFADKDPVKVKGLTEITQPYIVLNERYIEHINRCIVQPNLSGLLDERMISFYHKYKLIDKREYLNFMSRVNN